jgi:hypothetical protein
MRTALALAAVLLLTASACGTEDGATATDPGPGRPTAVPAAPGAVVTRSIVTVMDTRVPELCLGPVAESWPPQCSGPPIDRWDWPDHDGGFERQKGIRWGQFVVTGTWDGARFGYQDAIPAALHDATTEEPPAYPAPAVEHSPQELEAIAEEVGDLPGAQGAYADEAHVLVDVTYDDGSLQAWVDEEYGERVVLVSSMLVDADR